MLKVGITGGIGSGKSTICRIFSQLGIPVYNSDDRAKILMVKNNDVVNQITKIFGKDAYKNGEPDRKYISAQAFYNLEKLQQLNAIVHPAVFKDFAEWSSKYTNLHYIIKEAALLFESGSYRELDIMINVNAPVELRIKRVLERDGLSEDEIKKRIAAQWSDEKRSAYAHYTIVNDGTQMLLPQVLHLHKLINETQKTQ